MLIADVQIPTGRGEIAAVLTRSRGQRVRAASCAFGELEQRLKTGLAELRMAINRGHPGVIDPQTLPRPAKTLLELWRSQGITDERILAIILNTDEVENA